MKYLVVFILLSFIIPCNIVLQAQWVQTNLPNNKVVYCLETSGANIFAGTDSSGVFLSTNNGTDWVKVNNGIPLTLVHSLAVSGNNIFAGTQKNGVYLSTDNGTNWAQKGLNGSNVFSLAVSEIGIFAGTGDIVGGHVYLSTNNGTNWTPVNNGLPSNHIIFSLAIGGINIFAGTYFGVFLSTNNGADWTQVLNSSTIFSFTVSGTNIFAGNYVGDVFLSSDNGINWIQVSNGQPNHEIYSLVVNGNYIFAGTYGAGVWRRPLSELVGVTKDVNDIPHEFTLSQNYPNPFNPTTTIKYSIAKEGNVKLTIYNTIGRKVATIVNEYKHVGSYSAQFNATTLSSGVYFYKLESGSYSDIKKLVVIK